MMSSLVNQVKKEIIESKTERVELLSSLLVTANQKAVALLSGTKADVEDNNNDEVDIKVSDLAKRLAKIPRTDYKLLLQFFLVNPDVVAESKTDKLLVKAFNGQMDSKLEYARLCVLFDISLDLGLIVLYRCIPCCDLLYIIIKSLFCALYVEACIQRQKYSYIQLNNTSAHSTQKHEYRFKVQLHLHKQC